MFEFKTLRMNGLKGAIVLLVAASTSMAIAQKVTTLESPKVTLLLAQQHYFGSGSNLANHGASPYMWLVGGEEGGNGRLGRITSAGLYTAPQSAPEDQVKIEAVERASGKTVFTAQIKVSADTLVSEAHERWVEAAKEAAAEHGCDENLVVQAPSETVDDAVKLYTQVAGEHTCLILQPVSEDPNLQRYSFASGGEKDGVNILYISDVSRIRIWNGEEVAAN